MDLTPKLRYWDNGGMAADRREYLERLIMGLEQSVENTRAELPYYKPGDLQLKYAKKFLASVEENLIKSRKELEELIKASPCEPPRGE